MSNHNHRKLYSKPLHKLDSKLQQPKRKRSIIGFISVIACLIMLLLATSCQPKHPQIFTQLEVMTHD